MSKNAETPPPLRYLIKDKETVSITTKPNGDPDAPSWPCSEYPTVSSHDGSLVAIPGATSVIVVSTADCKKIYELNEPSVRRAMFSPKDTYLITWRNRQKEDEKTGGNVAIFNAKTGEVVRRFSQRNIERWPSVQWSNDEKYAVQMVTNQLRLYTDENPTRFVKKIDQAKVGNFAVAPSGAYVVAGSPEGGGQPGCVCVYSLPDMKVTLSRSMFKCEEFDFNWDPTGRYVLLQASVVSDQSGDSYYGESHSYLVHANGTFTQRLIFQNKGPIQDMAWEPEGKCFVIIQGHMPALASLYLPEGCVKKFEFGRASWNRIRWSPHGRFLLLGGFESLSGQMHFWDAYKRKKCGVAQDNSAPKYFEWAPDSRRFITATIRPLRTVDNGFKVWSYAGELKCTRKIDHLYQASFVNAPPGTYENKPQSPRLKGRKLQDLASAIPAKAYVPPSLRGRTGGLSAQLRKERQASGPTHLQQTGGKNVNKNRLKRERRRQRKAQEAAAAVAGKKVENETKKAPTPEPKKEEDKKEVSEKEVITKKIRGLKKKLKQISQLESKDKSALNEDQIKKLNNKANFEKDLATYEKRLAELA